MRIYISGPITGTDDYMERFAKAEKKLLEQGYSVVFNPAKSYMNMPANMTHEDYMKMCLEMMDLCDAIYMLSGWEKSCSANREYGYALGKDMTIVNE